MRRLSGYGVGTAAGRGESSHHEARKEQRSQQSQGDDGYAGFCGSAQTDEIQVYDAEVSDKGVQSLSVLFTNGSEKFDKFSRLATQLGSNRSPETFLPFLPSIKRDTAPAPDPVRPQGERSTGVSRLQGARKDAKRSA